MGSFGENQSGCFASVCEAVGLIICGGVNILSSLCSVMLRRSAGVKKEGIIVVILWMKTRAGRNTSTDVQSNMIQLTDRYLAKMVVMYFLFLHQHLSFSWCQISKIFTIYIHTLIFHINVWNVSPLTFDFFKKSILAVLWWSTMCTCISTLVLWDSCSSHMLHIMRPHADLFVRLEHQVSH